ncbi:MAG TPA: hypothetical protein VK149_02905 [Sideroxyarcus sp.]|nr:hypothetical protein [Sideroxyarcus sp.]
MRLKTTLLATTLAIFAASAPIAYADHHEEGKAGKSEAAKEKKSDKKHEKKKDHSHAEEKSGMPMSEAAGNKKEHDSMKMDMHEHAKERH